MADYNVPCCMMDHGVVQCGVMLWCDSRDDVARSKTIQCGASFWSVKAARGGLGVRGDGYKKFSNIFTPFAPTRVNF